MLGDVPEVCCREAVRVPCLTAIRVRRDAVGIAVEAAAFASDQQGGTPPNHPGTSCIASCRSQTRVW
jgi:hypothetical protein